MNATLANVWTVAALTMLTGFFFLLAGCEYDKSEPVREAQITVIPAEASVGPGETVEFKASGWPSYAWSLRDPNLGTLSNRSGERTRYTRIAGSNTVQVLTVRSGESNTNTVSMSTQVAIRHR